MLNQAKQQTTIADAVRDEALAVGYRRELASQPDGACRGITGCRAPLFAVPDRVREIAAKLGIDEASRRLETDRRVPTPSALIRTMREDWPEQSRTVAAYAKRNGLSLGEAWAELIADAARAGKRGRR